MCIRTTTLWSDQVKGDEMQLITLACALGDWDSHKNARNSQRGELSYEA